MEASVSRWTSVSARQAGKAVTVPHLCALLHAARTKCAPLPTNALASPAIRVLIAMYPNVFRSVRMGAHAPRPTRAHVPAAGLTRTAQLPCARTLARTEAIARPPISVRVRGTGMTDSPAAFLNVSRTARTAGTVWRPTLASAPHSGLTMTALSQFARKATLSQIRQSFLITCGALI